MKTSHGIFCDSSNIRIDLAYQGTGFSGFQKQDGLRTVQGVLDILLSDILKEPIQVIGAGRTDAGTHARHQVIHFKTTTKMPEQGICKQLQQHVPSDIRILDCVRVGENFHARYSAWAREYTYYFTQFEVPLVYRDSIHRVMFKPELSLLGDSIDSLHGTHNFDAFKCAGSARQSPIKTIYECDLSEICLTSLGNLDNIQIYQFRVLGNGFLYKMMRNLMGALFDVLRGKLTYKKFKTMVQDEDTRYNYMTAPAYGLHLERIYY